jgi:erythromycin esterase
MAKTDPYIVGIDIGSSKVGVLIAQRCDDGALEVVGTDVASTNALAGPQTGPDSATEAAHYLRATDAPSNLDFEGVATSVQLTSDWLRANASPLVTADPQASRGDLAPLQQMIGSAHLVGLGEDTHGTREFFLMKHRIVEMLVTDMGFTTFAIEAAAPEANDLNRYLLTGEGNPKVLLSRLYFWTWNTREVADMIEWMREWNAGAAPSRRVQFLGFDTQYPGGAMDSVQAFVTRIRPSDSAYVALRFNCMNPYRNVGPNASRSLYPSFYAGQPATAKAACAAGLQEVRDLVAADSARNDAHLPASAYTLKLHDARLVQQFEIMIGQRDAAASALARDRLMAENVGWIREQAGPGARIVLWAHNGHISSVPQAMGSYLRSSYGADYVNLGFLFGTGGFNAVGENGEGLKAWTATLVPGSSIEAIFLGTGRSSLLLDTRTLTDAGAPAQVRGPLPMRSIGSTFSTANESAYFTVSLFPNDFDLLVYLQTTTPSTLLPFIYQ